MSKPVVKQIDNLSSLPSIFWAKNQIGSMFIDKQDLLDLTKEDYSNSPDINALPNINVTYIFRDEDNYYHWRKIQTHPLKPEIIDHQIGGSPYQLTDTGWANYVDAMVQCGSDRESFTKRVADLREKDPNFSIDPWMKFQNELERGRFMVIYNSGVSTNVKLGAWNPYESSSVKSWRPGLNLALSSQSNIDAFRSTVMYDDSLSADDRRYLQMALDGLSERNSISDVETSYTSVVYATNKVRMGQTPFLKSEMLFNYRGKRAVVHYTIVNQKFNIDQVKYLANDFTEEGLVRFNKLFVEMYNRQVIEPDTWLHLIALHKYWVTNENKLTLNLLTFANEESKHDMLDMFNLDIVCEMDITFKVSGLHFGPELRFKLNDTNDGYMLVLL